MGWDSVFYIQDPSNTAINRKSFRRPRDETQERPCGEETIAVVIEPKERQGVEFMGHFILCPAFWEDPDLLDRGLPQPGKKDYIGVYKFKAATVSSDLLYSSAFEVFICMKPVVC